MAIKLSGYEPIIKDRVYIKNSAFYAAGKVLPMKEFLALQKYTLPTEEQVVKYLQQKIKEAEAAAAGRKLLGSAPGSLEEHLLNLSAGLRASIKSGKEEELTFIRENTPAVPAEAGKQANSYLEVRCGHMYADIFEEHRHQGVTKSVDWFYDAFCRCLTFNSNSEHIIEPVDKWGARLLLCDNSLPSKRIIDFLLGRSVGLSKELFMSRLGNVYINYPQHEVKKTLDVVYAGLNGNLHQVVDISEKRLQNAALPAIEALLAREQFQKQQSSKQQDSPQQKALVLWNADTKPAGGSGGTPDKSKPN